MKDFVHQQYVVYSLVPGVGVFGAAVCQPEVKSDKL